MTGLERRVTIVNEAGLHARPCHAIVSAGLEFESELRIRLDGREVDGKSILELMTLGAGKGRVLLLCAMGSDATALLDRLEALFAAGFDERP